MATRVKAAAVGQAYMRLKEKWTVYKCVKSVLVPNTALFMMWTEDDAKHHPSTVFQGNVRIASLKGVAADFVHAGWRPFGNPTRPHEIFSKCGGWLDP